MICESELEMSSKTESQILRPLRYKCSRDLASRAQKFLRICSPIPPSLHSTKGKNHGGVEQTPLTTKYEERADVEQKKELSSREKLI